ncbi:hypothetical protein C2S52_013678 [Perilla frutescens var. hirtella]|nr:hypothetical protein C2S52_013678 [Perilla frutescens var. hirtella]
MPKKVHLQTRFKLTTGGTSTRQLKKVSNTLAAGGVPKLYPFVRSLSRAVAVGVGGGTGARLEQGWRWQGCSASSAAVLAVFIPSSPGDEMTRVTYQYIKGKSCCPMCLPYLMLDEVKTVAAMRQRKAEKGIHSNGFITSQEKEDIEGQQRSDEPTRTR